MEDNDKEKASSGPFDGLDASGGYELSGGYWHNKYEAERSFWEERIKNEEKEKSVLKNETVQLKSLLDTLSLKVKDLEYQFSNDKVLYEQKIELKLQELSGAQDKMKYAEKIQQLEKRNLILRKGLIPQDVLEDTELRSPSAVIALASQKIMLDLALEKEALSRRLDEIQRASEKMASEKIAEQRNASEAQKQLEELLREKQQEIEKQEQVFAEKENKLKQANAVAVEAQKFAGEAQLTESSELAGAFALKVQDMATEIVVRMKGYFGKKKLSEETKAQILSMLEILNAISEFVSQFLDVSGKKPARLKDENITSVLDAVLEASVQRLQAQKISVERRYTVDLPKIQSDKALLTLAFKAVVDNAIEALPSGGLIVAETAAVGDGTVGVAISDSGPGIPRNDLEKIGSPYYTTKSGHQGLGIYTAKKIMKQHGGVLQISGAQGTQVKLLFDLPKKD